MKPSLDDTVTLRTAFVITQLFLESYWQRTGKGAEIGSLLGELAMLQDGGTADPAAVQDWLATAEAVLSRGQGPLSLELK